jgi:type IV pilus assembly protein PilM
LNLKRSINLRKDVLLGLDIGSSAVKIVALQRDDAGYWATGIGIREITAGEGEAVLRKDGSMETQDDDNSGRINTVKAIRECFDQVRIKTKMVVCGLSGPEVAVRDFEFPPLSAEDIEAAVRLEASQVCPFSAADSAVDYHLIPNGDDKTTGVLVAATNALIADKLQLVKEAGLNCVLMDVDGLAILNCFDALAGDHGEPEAKQTVAVLNVGGSHTTLAIMDDRGWPFIRDMTYAGDDILAQIAADNGTSMITVKRILSGDSAADEQAIADSLEKACRKLIGDVGETLRYYSAQSASSSVDKLFVCGGFALVKGFVELLNSHLGAEVVLWNPFEKIRCDANGRFKDILERTGPAMAVAAGLAMRSI